MKKEERKLALFGSAGETNYDFREVSEVIEACAKKIVERVEASPERTIALNKLYECRCWAKVGLL